ncbi:MAG: ABC transporter ATP-binding protein [Actinomycetales bacterium]
MRHPALAVHDLVVRYPGGRTPAVDHANWQAEPGQVTALLGPNGAGKTSTIECCVGLRRHSGGTLTILGRTGRALSSAEHRAQVAVMLQDSGLPTGTSARRLLPHLARFYLNPQDVPALCTRLGIDSFARTSIRRLSGGQRQRVALAAALVGRPSLVFLDEPTAGLDTQARRTVRELVREQCAEGVAVVLTTHDLDETARVADRVVVMHEGRVVADSTPGDLTRGLPRTLQVRLPAQADAAGLAAAVPGLAPGASGWTIRGPQVGPAMLTLASQWCTDNGYPDAELNLIPPSLEDAVIALTPGHEMGATSR